MEPKYPIDMDAEGAEDWCASRLSGKQITALGYLLQGNQRGIAGATLLSLNDFKRGMRGFMPPLILVYCDFSCFDGSRIWTITDFGKRVLESAMSAKAGKS